MTVTLLASEELTTEEVKMALQLATQWEGLEVVLALHCPDCRQLMLWSEEPYRSAHMAPMCESYQQLTNDGEKPPELYAVNNKGLVLLSDGEEHGN